MTTFTVEWTIEIEAKTPEDAARKALAILRDPAEFATLDVYNDDADERDGYHHHKFTLEAPDQPTVEEVASALRKLFPDGPPKILPDWQAELDQVVSELDAEPSL